MTKLFTDKCTIINQIPTSQTNRAKIAWKKHVITQCDIRNGFYDRSTDTMVYKAGSWEVLTKDWAKYLSPTWVDGGYYTVPDIDKDSYFTVGVGDLLIFAEISDPVPTNTTEFNELRSKYENMGGIITGHEVYMHFKPNGSPWNTNHIKIIKG